jgi:DNA invertase Pin-like site-specific DNA recombinase
LPRRWLRSERRHCSGQSLQGGLAEFERELIRSRTIEGRERAKVKGVVMGRKPKQTHHQRQEAIARREAGEALVDIGRSYNVSHSTIGRLKHQHLT